MTSPTNDLFTRRAPTAPSTANDTDRSVEVVFSTGADVPRRDYDGEYLERLTISPDAVDLTAFIGAPILDNHAAHSIRNILGAVESARIVGGEARARIKLSGRDDVSPIWSDIRDGIIQRVSVGYTVEEWTDQTDPRTGCRVRTAVRWTPREISLVAIPADRGAKFRNQEPHMPGQSY
ncbi:MAG TPA: hypothetical protein VEB64_00690 [Azospirillaceae bacterium]|nr:hypothetical protein [Azospirillaceae bacterium]